MACRLFGAIFWTNAVSLLIGTYENHFNDTGIKEQFLYTEVNLEISSAKWRTFCPRQDFTDDAGDNFRSNFFGEKNNNISLTTFSSIRPSTVPIVWQISSDSVQV